MSENLAQIHCMVVMVEFDYWKTLLDAWRAKTKFSKQRRTLTKFLHAELLHRVDIVQWDRDNPDEDINYSGQDLETVSFGKYFLIEYAERLGFKSHRWVHSTDADMFHCQWEMYVGNDDDFIRVLVAAGREGWRCNFKFVDNDEFIELL
jgi:hypothetical protein